MLLWYPTNPDSWLNQIVIDKGSQDGVEVDMSVMAGNGLIRVSEVNSTNFESPAFDHIQRTTNRVSAEIQTESGPVHGIVNGYDENTKMLSMSQIAPDAAINPGDGVITSGLGGVSPSALLIGSVKERYRWTVTVYLSKSQSGPPVRFTTSAS